MPGFDAKLPITHETIRAFGSRNDAEALVTLAAVAADATRAAASWAQSS